MNLVFVLLSVINVVITVCYKFSGQRKIEVNLPLFKNETMDKHAIVYYEDDINNSLVKSLLTRIMPDHTVAVIRGAHNVKRFRKILTKTWVRKLVLLTTNLNISEIDSNHFKILMNCFWSPLYIMWAKPNTICKNGTFDSAQLIKLELYLNAIWEMYRVTRVMVLFPYDCVDHYVIYGEKEFTSDRQIYKRGIQIIKTKNTNEILREFHKTGHWRYLTVGYPLKANIFLRFPTSVQECETVSKYTNQDYVYNNETYYCGLDGMVFYDYMTYHKFNLTKLEDRSCEKYGIHVEKDNVATGVLNCITKKKIDISFNSRFMVYYNVDNYTYTHYISIDSLCAILKRRGAIPLWHYTHNVFTPLIWALLLIVFIFIGMLTWISAKIMSTFFVLKPLKLYIYVFSSITASFFGFVYEKRKDFLVIKSTCLVCSIMLFALFQGHVNYVFTTKAWYPRCKTFDDLRRSSYKLYVSSSVLSLLKYFEDYEMNWREDVSMDDVLREKLIGTVDRKADLIVTVLYNYTDSEGIPLLDIVDQCFYTNFLAYMSNIDFIFNDATQGFMMRLLEAGLPNMYYVWTRRQFLRADKFLVMDSIPRPYDPFRLKNMRTVFGILAVGYLVSIFTFLVEIRKGRRRVHKV